MSMLVTGSHGGIGAVAFARSDVTDAAALAGAIETHDVTRIIHLTAFQIPLCRQDPARGALVNVVGTAAVVARALQRELGP